MMRLAIFAIIIIIAAIAEAADHTEVKVMVEDHNEEITQEVEANKGVTKANFRAIEPNTITPMVDIIITPVVIIGEEEVTAAAIHNTKVVAMAEVLIEVITVAITNITLMMIVIRWNNMGHHVHFAVVLITLQNIALREHDINNLMGNMSLGSSSQHQSGLYR